MPLPKASSFPVRPPDLSGSVWPASERRALNERRSLERRRSRFSPPDSEIRLRLAAKAAGFGAYDLNCVTGQAQWSPELKAMAGLPPGNGWVSLSALDQLLHPDDRQRVMEKLHASMDPAGPGEFEDEHRLRGADGSLRWVKASGRTFFSLELNDRRPLWATGIVIDITGRKEIEEALRLSRRKLDLAVRGAAIGIWNWNLATGELQWSERCYELFGLPAGSPLTFELGLKVLQPDDWQRTAAAVRRALDEHDEYSNQHRVVRPDGSIRWVEALGLGDYDDAGRAVGMHGIFIDITEHKTVEQALRQQAEQLGLALRAGHSGTFEWDARTFEHKWSDELLALYGLSRAEFSGRYENWLEQVEPEDREGCDSAMRQAIESGEFNHDFRIRRRDNGEQRWMNGRGLLSYDATGQPVRMVGINVDITEHKRAEDALRRQAMLLEIAHEPILVWSPEQGILFWNQGCRNLYGYSREEALGKGCVDLLDTAFPVSREDFLACLEREGQWMGEVRQTTRSGQRLVVISRLQRVRLGGETVILEANRDITDRKHMEEALQQVNEELERRIDARTAELVKANLALEQSNHELQQFAYIAAHDLQTPLRSISGFAQLLRKDYQGRLDAQADLWIDQLVDHTRRMQGLINDVLAYSRVEFSGSPFQPTDLGRLFDEIVASMEAAVAEAGGQVSRGELPVVMGDPVQLGQVLQNLIDNGLKYRRQGEAPRVHVAASLQNGEWRFSVSDNGIGIADRHRERIFEIFRRLHTQQSYPGSGIGLSVCRRVIQRHGGRIWVESEPGQGSVFHFTLPLIGPAKASAPG